MPSSFARGSSQEVDGMAKEDSLTNLPASRVDAIFTAVPTFFLCSLRYGGFAEFTYFHLTLSIFRVGRRLLTVLTVSIAGALSLVCAFVPQGKFI